MNFVSATQTYLNDSSQWQNNITAIQFSSLALGDIDNDGDLDLIAIGDCGINCYSSKIYLNNGTSLVENSIWQQNLTNVLQGSLALGDIDNDGDLDLILMGCSSGGGGLVATCNDGGYQTFLYLNNGSTFIESLRWQNNLTKSWKGSLTFGDVNNDGYLDLALTGQSANSKIAKIYINNGSTLTESSQWYSNLTALYESALAFGDIDNDGDLDLILCGDAGISDEITDIYLNNGTSLLENSVWSKNLLDVDFCSLAFGDIDNDGDLDLSLIGHNTDDNHQIYRNNGSTFVEINRDTDGGLVGIFAGSVAFGDYNTDGYLDLIATGQEGHTELYIYNKTVDNFTDYNKDPESHILNLEFGSTVIWVDIDKDTDLDLILTGYLEPIDPQTKVYISNRSLTKPNTKPNPPLIDFSSSYVNNVLKLGWTNASDVETNSSGLYYNLMIGNSTANHTIVSGVFGGSSNPTAGYFGNMMQRKNISLNVALTGGENYYWYVQTIDTGLSKSNWSAPQSFTTSADTTKPAITIINPSPADNAHTSNGNFVFNATVIDANLNKVELHANWTGSWIINETNATGKSGQNFTFIKNLTGFNDGKYAWYISANDTENNSQLSTARDFYLDRAYPIVKLVSPANAGSWTSSSTVTFTYNVTDTDIANCSLIINGAIDQRDISISENIAQTFSKTLSNGAYTWSVNCTDYVGYTNNSATRSLTVSYSAPCTNCGGGGGSSSGSATAATIVTPAVSVWTQTYSISNSEFASKGGVSRSLGEKERVSVNIEGKESYVGVVSVNEAESKAVIEVALENFEINAGDSKKFDTNSDGYYDLKVGVSGVSGSVAELTLESIHEEISAQEVGAETKFGEIIEGFVKWKYWIAGIALLMILIFLSFAGMKKKQISRKIEEGIESLREKAVKKIDMKTVMEKIRRVKEQS